MLLKGCSMRLVWWMSRGLRVEAVVICVSKSAESFRSLTISVKSPPLLRSSSAPNRDIALKPQKSLLVLCLKLFFFQSEINNVSIFRYSVVVVVVGCKAGLPTRQKSQVHCVLIHIKIPKYLQN